MDLLQPARRAPFWSMLAVCLGVSVLRIVDLLLFTDPLTGFVAAGPLFVRCAVLLCTVLLIRFTANLTSRMPLRNPVFNKILGLILLITGLLALSLRVWLWGAAIPLVTELLAYLTAVGMGFCAWRAATMRRRLPVMLPALLVTPWLLWVAAQRVLLGPAAIGRLSATVRAVSIIAALVFFVALLRMLFLPSQPGARTCFFAGFTAFFLCTCIELPQALYELAFGTLQAGALAEALVLAGLGVAGALCAWHATDPEQDG